MTISSTLPPASSRRQGVAALAYVCFIMGSVAFTSWILADLLERVSAAEMARERLAKLDGRSRASSAATETSGILVNGSPFLEGPTITVAGAALQKRVGVAVGKAGGAVLSSQVALDGPQAKAGFIGLTINIEIAQTALQTLLYDLEAGMPYLFVDALAIQAPRAFGESEGARMRVALGVSGQWQASR